MDRDATAARLATAAGRLARLHAAGPDPRARTVAGGIDVVDLGVDTAWSVQAYVPGDRAAVTPSGLAQALAWCRVRGGDRGYRVSVSEAQTSLLDDFGLVVRERLEVYAMPAADATAAPSSDVAGLEVGDAHSRDELVAAYGGWMGDLALAEGLVSADDMANPARRFLVGRVEGQPVGCALVWFAAGTACLSGIGIVAEARRRGYGRAVTAAAARAGALGAVGSAAPDLVWMHSTREGAALYATMGFQRVDVHLQLGPAGDRP